MSTTKQHINIEKHLEKLLVLINALGGDLLGTITSIDKDARVFLRHIDKTFRPAIFDVLREGKTVSLLAMAQAELFYPMHNSAIRSFAGQSTPVLGRMILKDVGLIASGDFKNLHKHISMKAYNKASYRRPFAIQIAMAQLLTQES